jgi:vacuolar-type H+-ATPase subunit D/Vma8
LPPRSLDLEIEVDRVWGVVVPALRALPVLERDLEARSTAPAATGPALFEATNHFESLASQLLHAATRELHVRALGTALSRTTRQLHALEQRVMPELTARIARVATALDERDREDQTRLRMLRRHH